MCFNDDIQGTGAVALAGIFSALQITEENIQNQRIGFLGAGSATVGIANMIVASMVKNGLTTEQARKQLWFVDSRGFVTTGRSEALAEHKILYARYEKDLKTLLEVVRKVKPTVMLGLSIQSNAFTEEVIREMEKGVERPIIFALSNPTDKSEYNPQQADKWTEGSVLYASGSPYAPVVCGDREFKLGQGNNMYISPCVGLGATMSESRTVTDSMFYAAAKALKSSSQ